jgi:hypothetical protein
MTKSATTMRRAVARQNIIAALCLVALSAKAAPDVTRAWFTPPVVPEGSTQQVRFEATVTENPASVAFEYNGVDRPMFDDGTNGDLVAADGTWTILFPANDIVSKLTPARVQRPIVGFCEPAGGGRLNVIGEVWTASLGLPAVQSIDGNAQQTDYIVNFIASRSQLLSFNAAFWANRFYAIHRDNFDFLNFLLVSGARGNRYHFGVRNDVQGIGLSIFNNTAQYGSSGRLKGCTVFPIPYFFDTGAPAFSHETGHQWINFLQGTPFASGTPHWPRGDIAINVMGFSIPGSGAGGTYSYTFTPNGAGGFTVGAPNPMNTSTFNTMELYLMGLAPPTEVGNFFVLNNQNQNLTLGQVLQPSEFTVVAVSNVIAARGARAPDSASAQKTFRCATVVLSEQLLDSYAMSFYDWFARRAEHKQPLSYAEGLANGTANPFYAATGGRGVMFASIRDEQPTLRSRRLSNGNIELRFTAKLGIQYQLQSSPDLFTWSTDGPPVSAPVSNPPADAELVLTRAPAMGMHRFYRLTALY